MELQLEVFQDQLNGMIEYNMEHSLIVIGCSSKDFYHVSYFELNT